MEALMEPITAPWIELLDVSLIYPGVVALDRVSLSVTKGEVIGLVGENGAGKSSLMKVLGGIVSPTSGTIRIDEVTQKSLSITDAIRSGIAFVHQELNLFDNLDAAANVFIGREPLLGGPLKLIDRKRLYADAEPIFDRLGVDFLPTTPVADLSIAQRQLLEIMKALSLNSRLVIMDEPTSSLTLAETGRLLDVIAGLKAQGVSVIFISHRLGEVEKCADRAIVMRDGQVVGHLGKQDISHNAMIKLMIGRDLKSLYVPPASGPGACALELEGVETSTFPGKALNLSVHRGEILGLAGLVGSGRTELARAIFGIEPLLSGVIRLDGQPFVAGTPAIAIEQGLFLVPEDRKRSGLLLDMSIAQNISLPDLAAYSRAFIVQAAPESANAETQKKNLNIRAPAVATKVSSLSGGNQQKVVLAKWLSMKPRIIIFDEPTRGIDVGAKKEIYDMVRGLADSGVAILMISSDMEEVIGVSDRIAVMHEGRISGLLDRPDFSEHNVLQLAVGNRLN